MFCKWFRSMEQHMGIFVTCLMVLRHLKKKMVRCNLWGHGFPNQVPWLFMYGLYHLSQLDEIWVMMQVVVPGLNKKGVVKCYIGKRYALKKFFCIYIKLYQTYFFDLDWGHCITCQWIPDFTGQQNILHAHMTSAPITMESHPSPSKNCWCGLEKTVVSGPKSSVVAGSDQKAGRWQRLGGQRLSGGMWGASKERGSFYEMRCGEVMEMR